MISGPPWHAGSEPSARTAAAGSGARLPSGPRWAPRLTWGWVGAGRAPGAGSLETQAGRLSEVNGRKEPSQFRPLGSQREETSSKRGDLSVSCGRTLWVAGSSVRSSWRPPGPPRRRSAGLAPRPLQPGALGRGPGATKASLVPASRRRLSL